MIPCWESYECKGKEEVCRCSDIYFTADNLMTLECKLCESRVLLCMLYLQHIVGTQQMFVNKSPINFFKLWIIFLFSYYILCLELKGKTQRKCRLLRNKRVNSLKTKSVGVFLFPAPTKGIMLSLQKQVHLRLTLRFSLVLAFLIPKSIYAEPHLLESPAFTPAVSLFMDG